MAQRLSPITSFPSEEVSEEPRSKAAEFFTGVRQEMYVFRMPL